MLLTKKLWHDGNISLKKICEIFPVFEKKDV